MSLLPPEVLLQIASVSPSAWLSLVGTLRCLALYARYSPFFLSRLQEEFKRPVSSWFVLPDGSRHGPCTLSLSGEGFLLLGQILPPRLLTCFSKPALDFPPDGVLFFSYRRGRLSGPLTLVGGSSVLLRCTLLDGLLSGPLEKRQYCNEEYRVVTRTKFFCGTEMGRCQTWVETKGRRWLMSILDVWAGEFRGYRHLYTPEGDLQSITSRPRREDLFFSDGLLLGRTISEKKSLSQTVEGFDRRGFLVARRVPLEREERAWKLFFSRGTLVKAALYRFGLRHGPTLVYREGGIDTLTWFLGGREVSSSRPERTEGIVPGREVTSFSWEERRGRGKRRTTGTLTDDSLFLYRPGKTMEISLDPDPSTD